ncbi:hypothetical protein [Photobacterium leiognathi]|nr:hypothetical protein [Photobacterium leiognathi]
MVWVEETSSAGISDLVAADTAFRVAFTVADNTVTVFFISDVLIKAFL